MFKLNLHIYADTQHKENEEIPTRIRVGIVSNGDSVHACMHTPVPSLSNIRPILPLFTEKELIFKYY